MAARVGSNSAKSPSRHHQQWHSRLGDLRCHLLPRAQKAAGTNTVTLVLCCGNSISPLFSTNSVVFDSKENGASTAPKLLINSTSTLTDTGDALVYGGTTGTTTNYGSATNLVVSYNYNNAANNRWSYIQFDLSSVSSITSAILQLHRQAETYADEFPVGVYACPTGTTWSESTITWNTKPALLASSTDPIGSPFYNGSTHPCAGRIAISANNPNNLVWLPQGSTSVALYSKDRGVNWTASTGGPTSQALGRDTPSTLIQQLAADRVNGNFYLAKFGGGAGGTHAIYTSTTGGASWTQVSSTGPGDNNIYRAQLVAAPVAGDIWVCDDGTGHTAPVGGLWHSINGGTSWSQVGSGTISLVREVAFGKGTGGASYSVFFSGCLSGRQGRLSLRRHRQHVARARRHPHQCRHHRSRRRPPELRYRLHRHRRPRRLPRAISFKHARSACAPSLRRASPDRPRPPPRAPA